MKIGPHITRSTPQGAAWARRAAIVKSLDDVGPLIAAPDWAIRIYRHVWQSQDDAARLGGEWMADELISRLGGYVHPRLYVEIVNEWKQGLDELPLLCDISEAATRRLHASGYKVAGFCFSSGNPTTWQHWDYLKGRGFCGVDLIALHEYWAAAGFSTWNALRYRRVHDYLRGQHPPFVVTECGRDAIAGEGGEGKPGWQLQTVSAEDYARELLAYAAELERDPYVVGATAYALGTWNDFRAFDLEVIAPLMPAADGPITVANPPPLPPTGGGSKVYEFKLAFADYARQHPEIGKATSDISYYPPSNPEGHQLITQWCEKGKLEYNEGAGVVAFFPFGR
jgi:hypothetical protein